MDNAFDPATHTYTIDKTAVPSVTEVIKLATNYGSVPSSTLETARERGVAVDEACTLYDMDDLVISSLDPVLMPYMEGWIRFRNEFQPTIVTVQDPLYSKKLMLAGTPDRRVIMRNGKKLKKIILDIKATYKIEPSVQLQLSGYDLLLDGWADELLCVRLTSKGFYETQFFKKDHASFLSFFGVYKWLRKNQ